MALGTRVTVAATATLTPKGKVVTAKEGLVMAKEGLLMAKEPVMARATAKLGMDKDRQQPLMDRVLLDMDKAVRAADGIV